MGKLEKKFAKKRKRTDLRRVVLATIGAAGIIGVGLLAPNVIGTMGKLGMIPSKRQKDSIRDTRDRLLRLGLLSYVDGKLRLTDAGKRKLNFLTAQQNQGNREKRKWDGRWRVLIFDIPERRRQTRDMLRRSLSSVGFIRLQHSVWVFPYDCEDFATLLKADFKIGKDMLYMIVDMLENDIPIRKHFALPRA